jgi:hypothetical protein
MANKKDLPNDIGKTQDQMNYLTVSNEAADLLAGFNSVTEEQLQQLNGEYLNFKPNSKYSFIFNGMTTVKMNDGKEVECCKLIDEKNNQFINGNTVLTRTLSAVTQVPCFVRIVTKNIEEGKQGKYMDMNVFVLPQSVAK